MAQHHPLRQDLKLINDMIEDGTRVLDIGCGDGELLHYLSTERTVDGRGMELSMSGVQKAVARGLAVVQGDAETDLSDYPKDAFDYVILSKTLQATLNPRKIIDEMLRIGKHAIVSFPNFGHWRTRVDLLMRGRMPVNDLVPYSWYETPNIHFCTIQDFVALCRDMDIEIKSGKAINAQGQVLSYDAHGRWANLFAADALFLLKR
jgi:methionine biosynthesis protein MetW